VCRSDQGLAVFSYVTLGMFLAPGDTTFRVCILAIESLFFLGEGSREVDSKVIEDITPSSFAYYTWPSTTSLMTQLISYNIRTSCRQSLYPQYLDIL
jgi:hypothetical protein